MIRHLKMFAKDIVIAAINSSLSAEKEKRKYPVIRFWSGHNILHIVMVFSINLKCLRFYPSPMLKSVNFMRAETYWPEELDAK